MNMKSLGEAISLSAAAAQTAVELTATPFEPGFNAVAELHQLSGAGAYVVKVQGSDDGTTYTDLVVFAAGAKPCLKASLTLMKYMRANVTTAGSAGTANVYLTI